MTTQEQRILLPIGSRVTHWDGGPNTHGKGTIIGYNGIEPMEYLRTNFKEAVEMAAGAGLIGGIVSAMYDKNRCPYIVQFDVREGDDEKSVEMRTKYPRGYRDVYEHDSVRSYPNPHYSFTIFPNDWVRIMGRKWEEERNNWGPWLIMPEDLYEERKDEESVKKEWQFCVRPLPIPAYHNSPVNGDFVPLTLGPDSTKCDLKGFHPPHGIFVEFKIHGSDETILGMTSELIMLPPGGKWKMVFTTVEPGKERVYLTQEVSHWRELIHRERFTPALMEHVQHSFTVYNHDASTKAPK